MISKRPDFRCVQQFWWSLRCRNRL